MPPEQETDDPKVVAAHKANTVTRIVRHRKQRRGEVAAAVTGQLRPPKANKVVARDDTYAVVAGALTRAAVGAILLHRHAAGCAVVLSDLLHARRTARAQ